MSSDRLMRIRSAEFQAMADRVLRATELTSRLNVLPFEDEAGKAELFEQILGVPGAACWAMYARSTPSRPPIGSPASISPAAAASPTIVPISTITRMAGSTVSRGAW
ncbi:MAG: hypothetical protein QOC94_525 [Actinoplanes sp.]|jgi:hypothetical protein|nr:hypothetical protein [Actinoplanes sp.]